VILSLQKSISKKANINSESKLVLATIQRFRSEMKGKRKRDEKLSAEHNVAYERSVASKANLKRR